uniref:Aa_trans domain-containing protein n=1 Tax=Syphacia muris TaxID=451379 RepID=A0A0N5AEM6_9BILA
MAIHQNLDFVFVEGKFKRHSNEIGLGWLITVFIVIGEIAGGGIVALPNAVISAGAYFGFGMLVAFALMAGYTAVQIGECWSIMQEKWPIYRKHQRQPYAEMGFRASGNQLRFSITIVSNFSLFGTTVVLILLAAKNMSSFLSVFLDLEISICYLILIVGIVLIPLTFFKSPKDFWIIIVFAMIATAIAVVLIVIGSIHDAPYCKSVAVVAPSSSVQGIFHAFGTLIFAYGGHGCFPTIAHDMRSPYRFRRTAICAFAATFILYLLVSWLGYSIYGNSVRESVILSIQVVWIQQAINIVIALHVFLSITIMINPINQEIEEYFKIAHDFGWGRVVTRCTVMLFIVFVAESMPHFSVVLDLFGGSALTLITLIFPILCYLPLKVIRKLGKSVDENYRPSLREVIKHTSWPILLINGSIIVIGIVGGVGTTLFSFKTLIADSFEPPCYIRSFINWQNSTVIRDITNCCGPAKNVSVFGDPETYCSIYTEQ